MFQQVFFLKRNYKSTHPTHATRVIDNDKLKNPSVDPRELYTILT